MGNRVWSRLSETDPIWYRQNKLAGRIQLLFPGKQLVRQKARAGLRGGVARVSETTGVDHFFVVANVLSGHIQMRQPAVQNAVAAGLGVETRRLAQSFNQVARPTA